MIYNLSQLQSLKRKPMEKVNLNGFDTDEIDLRNFFQSPSQFNDSDDEMLSVIDNDDAEYIKTQVVRVPEPSINVDDFINLFDKLFSFFERKFDTMKLEDKFKLIDFINVINMYEAKYEKLKRNAYGGEFSSPYKSSSQHHKVKELEYINNMLNQKLIDINKEIEKYKQQIQFYKEIFEGNIDVDNLYEIEKENTRMQSYIDTICEENKKLRSKIDKCNEIINKYVEIYGRFPLTLI